MNLFGNNIVWDAAMSWANKFAYRVLDATGASESVKAKFLQAIADKN